MIHSELALVPEGHSTMHSHPPQNISCLRIGVMVGSLQVPAWIDTILQDIQTSDFLEIGLVVVSQGRRGSYWQRLKPIDWSAALFRWYAALDYRLFKAKRDAFKPVDLRQTLPLVASLQVLPIQGRFEDRFQEADVAKIQGANLDVILYFGSRVIDGKVLECARYGIWSVRPGDDREYRSGAALFWEIHHRNPVSATTLQILRAKHEDHQVIYRSFAATDFISLYRTRNATYWKTAEFVMRRLRDLHRCGWSYLQLLASSNREDGESKQICRVPGNLTMARFLVRLLLLIIVNQSRKLVFNEQWFVAIRNRCGRDNSAPDMTGFRPLLPPHDRFQADPFVFKRGTTNYVFFEEYRYACAKGVISCMQVDHAGCCAEPQVVLEKEYHLSYPFVFEWHGQVYMIPETRDNRTIELYRAVHFPHEWALETVLMGDVSAVDGTLFQQNGKFWLFANLSVEGGSPNDELFLFWADSPLGPWEAHPRNPVVSDVRRARPAGALFLRHGQLIRPSQDCSVRYGYAISLNRVEVLSETEYREIPIGRIEPDWLPGNLVSHTYNCNEDFEVADGRLLRVKRGLLASVRLKALGSVGLHPSGHRCGSGATGSAPGAPANAADESAIRIRGEESVQAASKERAPDMGADPEALSG